LKENNDFSWLKENSELAQRKGSAKNPYAVANAKLGSKGIIRGAEQNYASNSFNSELIKRFQQLLANLSIIIGSALVEEKRQLNHSSN
jgi:predicted transglutaminase-like protease